jgi:hypothetical protein
MVPYGTLLPDAATAKGLPISRTDSYADTRNREISVGRVRKHAEADGRKQHFSKSLTWIAIFPSSPLQKVVEVACEALTLSKLAIFPL